MSHLCGLFWQDLCTTWICCFIINVNAFQGLWIQGGGGGGVTPQNPPQNPPQFFVFKSKGGGGWTSYPPCLHAWKKHVIIGHNYNPTSNNFNSLIIKKNKFETIQSLCNVVNWYFCDNIFGQTNHISSTSWFWYMVFQ